ncbi:hypothetical protein MMC19_004416 [Ptychographa xylographoides]|nr:hypothetical protein [Ptychographa xylographoides]
MSHTPSTITNEDRPSCIAGFKKHTPYDPFLPRSPNEEQMMQVNPGSRSQQFSTDNAASTQELPPQSAYEEQGLPSLPSSIAQNGGMWNHQPELLLQVQGTPHTIGPSMKVNGTPGSCNSASPTNGYHSEYEYATSEAYVMQDFDNTFLLEADFGPLPIPEENQEVLQDIALQPADEPESATTTTSQPLSFISRKSTGIATLSSHLMSPSLTETTSPSSGTDVASPILKTRLLGGGTMSRLSSQSTTTEQPRSYGGAALAQHTPAMTGSSVEASPEPTSRSELASNVSPTVRIESYSRGDSPARTADPIRRSGSKRSRASHHSTHLAAPHDESSEEEEGSPQTGEIRERPNLTFSTSTNYHGPTVARTGLDPTARNAVANEEILNFKDQTEQAELHLKNAEVSRWLAASDAGSDGGQAAPALGVRKYDAFRSRRRAKSTSAKRDLEEAARGIENATRMARNAKIPGPGRLLEENSGDEEEDDDDDDEEQAGSQIESPPASIVGSVEAPETPRISFQGIGGELHPEAAHPWVDPVYLRSQLDSVGQPLTSNAAIVRFIKHAADIETASRAATWGTINRRMSEADLERIIDRDGLLSRLSISKDKTKDKGERRGSFMEQVEQAASRLIPKRSSSHLRRKSSEPTKYLSGEGVETESSRKEPSSARKESLHGRKESLGSRNGSPSVSTSLRRLPSVGRRPKSPKLNTGSAVAAVPTQKTASGGHASSSPTASPPGAWNAARNAFKRTARGEFHRNLSSDVPTPGIADLWNKQGGPPLPAFTSPPGEKEMTAVLETVAGPDEDAESEEITDEKSVAIDFTPRYDLIIPTYDGFRLNVSEINPRLAVYLTDRIGQEQLRRYKKLVEFKVKHAQAHQLRTCKSGDHCFENGGSPTYFPPKSSQKEPRLTHTGFSTVLEGGLDEDDEAVAEGAVTAAQFPLGVPMPPVKRLPAQFECPLCFEIKKFQKPSDWSKHVHEDLQPFTCTFQNCPDPKSFKRKADWVRHENERHRQLEWWKCTEQGCSHKCYRRDNFVQHLVREHKMPEPRIKNAKPNKPAVRGPAKAKARANKESDADVDSDDRVLKMIETCRHETPKQSVDEPCRFCGNICSSWKKLTVHLARHMEQISMPVLELVRQKDVSPETIISPIEPRATSQNVISTVDQLLPDHGDPNSLSAHDTNEQMRSFNPELPGSFTPIQGSVIFHDPNYKNQPPDPYSWNHATSNSHQTQRHIMPAVYSAGANGAYPHSQTGYQESPLPQFQLASPLLSFSAPSSTSEAAAIYGALTNQTRQISHGPYHSEQSHQNTMEQGPPYLNEYTAQNSPPSTQPRHMLANRYTPVQFNQAESLPYSQASPDPSYYNTPHQAQFYPYEM